MFFRAWFYVSKLVLLCFPLVALGSVTGPRFPAIAAVAMIALVMMVPICAFGAGLGVAIFIFGVRLRCPCCGGLADPGGRGFTLWLDCERCGLVHGNVVLDLALRVTPPGAADEREHAKP